MDLSTTYLGRRLRTPLVPSASPLSEGVDQLRRMEDAGASAVVLPSIYEEQIEEQDRRFTEDLERGTESFAEAITYAPRLADIPLGPEAYLDHVRRAKEALGIPVFASINGSTPGGWTSYAAKIEQAGADGIELNMYDIPTDPRRSGAQVEARYLQTVRSVRSAVKIPLAVKLSPFFSSLAGFAIELVEAGVDGLVLFNRFFQPDIDIEDLKVEPSMSLSTSESLRLPLRWIAILRGLTKASLGATGGIHTGVDAIKAVMAGADAAFLCSVLLKQGVRRIKEIEVEMARWMEDKGYDCLARMKGTLSHARVENPSAYERALYIGALTARAKTGAR
ncbi:MAG: dihydroorotate dehydrogenase-like protein [Elusimicrobia bacterium]|nr:dihydroorotate dehydrogenase-like protein [Elusimicrobiota bacterium]